MIKNRYFTNSCFFKKQYCLLLLFIFHLGYGQSIWTNPITDTNPSSANPYTNGDVKDPNITVSGIRRGPNVVAVNTPNQYVASGWNDAVINGAKYFEFTLSPQQGYKINFVSLVFDGVSSGTGPVNYGLYSSVDNFEFPIGTVVEGVNTINLSDLDFQNVIGTITFRIYAWNASSSAGAFGIQNFTFNGAVVPNTVPTQPIWSNLITASDPSASNPYTTGDLKDANISVSGISRGPGITGFAVSGRYDAIGWDSAGLNANDYFEFTLTPNSSYKINLQSFVFDGQSSSADAPTQFALQSSLDNFSSQILLVEDLNTIDLSNAIYQNLTGPVTFRIYAWGGSAPSGRFGINSFTFNGTVTIDSQADVTIWSNPIINSNPSAFNPYTIGSTEDTRITVSGISRGSGITGRATSNRYDAVGWDSPSLDPNDYFEFTLVPNAGNKINFTSFVFDGQTAGITAPTNFALRSSVDGYVTDIGVVQEDSNTIDLTTTIFQDISGPITFRLYAWGAADLDGRYGINSFEFKGNIVTSSCVSPTISTSGIIDPANFNATASTTVVLVYANTTGNPVGYSIDWNFDATTAGLVDQSNPSQIFNSGSGNLNIVIPANILPGTYDGLMTIGTGSCSTTQLISITILSIPPAIAGTSLWLKANDGVASSGTSVVGWADQTGKNKFSVIGAPTYHTNAINFNEAVSFNNNENSQLLPTNRLDGNTNIDFVSAFAVYEFDDNLGQSNFLGSVDSPNTTGVVIFGGNTPERAWVANGIKTTSSRYGFYINSSNFDDRKFNIVNLDATNQTLFGTGRVNGYFENISNGGADIDLINFRPMIGGSNHNNATDFGHMKGNGLLAEVIVFPVTMSETDKLKIESYLAIKYGVSLGSNSNAVAYLSSSGSVIRAADNVFKYDIFGIGKDDGANLNQTKSNSIGTGSGDGTGQTGKGNIVLSNPSALDTGDFFLIGHDNGALTEQTTDLPSNLAEYKRISREWKVSRTNDPGTMDMTFDISGLCLSVLSVDDIKMLVDSNQDGIFDAATLINAASLTGNIVSFSGINLPNNAVFTFLTSPPTIQLTSAVGTDAQTICGTTTITDIIYTTTNATGTVVTGLPTGVDANFASNVLTISGTPTVLGNFTYTIEVQGAQCATGPSITGSITVSNLAKPVITPTGSTSICAAGSVLLNSAATTGNQWYKDGTLIPGAVANDFTATDPGSYTVIATQGGCSSPPSDAVVVTVNPLPTIDAATSATSVCQGTTSTNLNYTATGNPTLYDIVWEASALTAGFLNSTNSSIPNATSGTITINIPSTILAGTYTGTITVKNANNCTSIADSFIVVVNEVPTITTTGVIDTICFNATATTTAILPYTATSGNPNSYSIDWNSAANNAGLVDQVNITQLFNSGPGNVNITIQANIPPGTYSGIMTIGTGNCTATQAVSVTILPTPTATISGGATVCERAPSPLITFSNPQSEAIVVSYRVNPGGPIQTINIGPNTSGTVAVSTDFFGSFIYILDSVAYTTLPGCSTPLSGSASVNVDQNLISVTVVPNTSQNLCIGGTGTQLSVASEFGGGSIVARQWFKRATSGGTNVVISTATSSTYTPTASDLGEGTWYLVCESTPLCGTPVVSNEIQVRVNSSFTPGAIATTGETICSGGDPSVIGSVTPASGGDGTMTYEWYSSTNGFIYTSILGANSLTYNPPAGLTEKTWYRRQAIDGTCNTNFNNPNNVALGRWIVDITPDNSVTASTSPTVCRNNLITPITHATTGATGIGTATGLPTGVTASWTTNTITISGTPTASGTFNYSIPLTGGCGSVNATGTIIVRPEFIAGAIPNSTEAAPGEIICSGGDPALIGSTTLASGGDGTITYEWQSSTNGFIYLPIAGSNSVTYDPPAGLIQKTWFRRAAKDATCQTNSGNPQNVAIGRWIVDVNPQPTKPTITASSSTSFCSPGSVVLSSSATTGNQWYKDGILVVGATASTYTASDSGSYTVEVTQNGCTSELSDGLLVTANATPSIPVIRSSRNTTICEGNSVRLYTSSATGTLWFKDGVVISGATGSE
ncbi:hypothetical protein, partial [Flavobacterium sp. 9R]|uniref:beta strand repeat-containing protein n=1 Tax=Flavobacterium sp. 9R TaxID=2653143 RepID=UPI00135AEABD